MKSKLKCLFTVLTAQISLFLCAGEQSDFTINGMKTTGFKANETSWNYQCDADLTKQLPAEFLLGKNVIKQHKKYAHIKGCVANISLTVKAPGPVKTLDISTVISNFADSVTRNASVSCSVDGINFITVAEKDFKGANNTISGKLVLPANKGILYIKIAKNLKENDKNGKYSFVLFQKVKLNLTGIIEKQAIAAKTNTTSPYASYVLKENFPTGVFWPWERTQPNADHAKMELWAFVDKVMKTLKDHGFNTLWFVNLNNLDYHAKVLTIAEKYGLKVLLNTDAYNVFYNDAQTLSRVRNLAMKTTARIGHFPALLGYVLKDEPLMCDIETCGYLYNLMKEIDPKRESVSVVMNRQSISYLRDSKLPVVCSDVYYFSDDNSTMLPSPRKPAQNELTNALRNYGENAELYGKHSWFMGQMFGTAWGRHYRKGDKMIVYPGSYLHWRMPTEAESRWQFWEALRLGTKGTFIYVLFPPVPLYVTPEKATTPYEKKRVANMDKLAKIASTWKGQKLTTKMTERDPGEGMLEPGGEPTKQMRAVTPFMKLMRANEKLLLARKTADFPVFFATDNETNTATFISGKRWLGVIVNRNVDKNRKVTILLPPNVKAIRNIANGKSIPIVNAKNEFRKIQLNMKAGDGALLEAEFSREPGMRFCLESFNQPLINRMTINKNAEIFQYGRYGADTNRALRLKKDGDPTMPVCAMLNLTKKSNSQRTYSMNLNLKKRAGIIYGLARGKIKSLQVKTVKVGIDGEKANFAHLRNNSKVSLHKMDGKLLHKGDSQIPFIVPVGTNALEFYLSNPKDYIDDITVWFVPDNI